MAFTQTQLDALDQAISLGVTTVDYGDRKVAYRSLAEMTRLRDMMRRDLGQTTGAPKTIRTVTRNGF